MQNLFFYQQSIFIHFHGWTHEGEMAQNGLIYILILQNKKNRIFRFFSPKISSIINIFYHKSFVLGSSWKSRQGLVQAVKTASLRLCFYSPPQGGRGGGTCTVLKNEFDKLTGSNEKLTLQKRGVLKFLKERFLQRESKFIS